MLPDVRENPRVMGLESECALLVNDGKDNMLQECYDPPLERLSRKMVEELFGLERPTMGGQVTFGRIYREPVGGFAEIATRPSLSAIETIALKQEGEKYVQKLGQGMLKLAEQDRRAKPIERATLRTLGSSGTTCGMHENYLGMRELDMERDYGPVLMSHLVTRLWSFAGGAKLDPDSGEHQFIAGTKLSSVKHKYMISTSSDKKPIVNLRDDIYADQSTYRRIHVTSGDGNLWPWPEFMKLTTTSLVLRLVENKTDCQDIELAEPLKAARDCMMPDIRSPEELNSRISNLSVELVNGERIHPLELQLRLMSKCRQMAKTHYISAEEAYALGKWEWINDQMLEDAWKCHKHVEFIGKLIIGQGIMEKRQNNKNKIQMDWDAIESAWSDLHLEHGIGIANRDRIKQQQEIMNISLMSPSLPTRSDALLAAKDWLQASEYYERMHDNLYFMWNGIYSSIPTSGVSLQNPYDGDPNPAIEFLEKQAKRASNKRYVDPNTYILN